MDNLIDMSVSTATVYMIDLKRFSTPTSLCLSLARSHT